MGRGWVLVAAAVACAAPVARGQEFLFQQPQVVDPAAVGGQFLLAPAGGPVAPAAPLPDPAKPGDVAGVVGGFGVGNRTIASVGFTYLFPWWSYQDFQFAVPPGRGFEGQFPVFGNTGRVDSRFAYAPRVNLDYYVRDLDLAVGASGTFLNLTGRIDRQAGGSGGPSGQLTATSNLTLVSANLVEFSRQFAFLEIFPEKTHKKPAVVDSVVELRLGTRYVSLEQNYTGTLLGGGTGVAGSSVATRFSTQSFRGIGITTAGTWELPVGVSFTLFGTGRQSVLLGDNRRNSSVSVTAPGLQGFSETQYDNRTAIVPVTELEIGFNYGPELADRLRDGLDPPRFLLKVAGVAQFWGDMGPLSAGSTSQRFKSTDLFLFGGYVQAGFRY